MFKITTEKRESLTEEDLVELGWIKNTNFRDKIVYYKDNYWCMINEINHFNQVRTVRLSLIDPSKNETISDPENIRIILKTPTREVFEQICKFLI